MGTHFFESDDPIYIAKKSLRVNLSDLISKGVTPYGYFLSLAMDDTIDENWIKLFSQDWPRIKRNIILLCLVEIQLQHPMVCL